MRGGCGLSKVLNPNSWNKGRKYRCNLEIARDMLLIASVKVRKTRLMYQANLSYQVMEKYLKTLLDNDLVECHDDSCYLITQKGKEFIQMYSDYLERHRRIREEIDDFDKDRLTLENMCFNIDSNSKRMANRKEVLV